MRTTLIIATIAALPVLAACNRQSTSFDKMKINAVETGPVPASTVDMLPDEDRVVVYERKNAGILVAYFRETVPCPSRMINSVSGIRVKPDRIQLCFEPVESSSPDSKSFNSCPYDLAIKYEIQGIPKSVEPKFEIIGACSE